MLFWSHKKQSRDQIAGLVFRWRAARRHHAGKVVALFLSSVFFAFVIYALRVEVLRAPLLTKRTGEVLMLNPDNPYCAMLMLQVEERSPFPLRWDPAFDLETMGRIAVMTNKIEGRVWTYQPGMHTLPEVADSVGLPSVFEAGDAGFVSLRSSWSDFDGRNSIDGQRGGVNLRALMVAGDSIRARLPSSELSLPGGMIADEWYGQSFRFLMSIDANGVVRGCLPLSGSSMEVSKPTEKQKLLSAWLRRIVFTPSRDGVASMGVLEFQIEAREE